MPSGTRILCGQVLLHLSRAIQTRHRHGMDRPCSQIKPEIAYQATSGRIHILAPPQIEVVDSHARKASVTIAGACFVIVAPDSVGEYHPHALVQRHGEHLPKGSTWSHRSGYLDALCALFSLIDVPHRWSADGLGQENGCERLDAQVKGGEREANGTDDKKSSYRRQWEGMFNAMWIDVQYMEVN